MARLYSFALLVSVATAAASFAGVSRMQPRLAHRAIAVTMAADEPQVSRSKEYLEEAENEEEQGFNDEIAAASALARSPEAIAALKSTADAAVAALREADKPGVAAALESRGKSKATGSLAKALRKPSKTLAIVGEGVMMDTDFLGGDELNDPSYLSEQYRTGGCSAVSVLTSCEGALSEQALTATISEQETARGNFPSPLPAISRALFVDDLQLAEAKADGASAAVLSLALNGKEKTGELMATAADLGLESIVRVCDSEQLAAAIELDAKIVVIGDCSLVEASALLDAMPASDGPVTVSDLAFLDVRGAWKVRDAGFNAMFVGKSLLEVCVRDRVPPTAICKAILSKGSVKYGLGMQKGRLEGSKEFLGSLSM